MEAKMKSALLRYLFTKISDKIASLLESPLLPYEVDKSLAYDTNWTETFHMLRNKDVAKSQNPVWFDLYTALVAWRNMQAEMGLAILGEEVSLEDFYPTKHSTEGEGILMHLSEHFDYSLAAYVLGEDKSVAEKAASEWRQRYPQNSWGTHPSSFLRPEGVTSRIWEAHQKAWFFYEKEQEEHRDRQRWETYGF